MTGKKVTTTTKVNTFAYDPDYDGSFALWVFTPFGLVMPCVDPSEPDLITVRARDAAHLDAFREQFCPELGKVVLTPDRDYDVRATVGREAFARAMTKMASAIDSPRFKPLSEGPRALSDQDKAATYHGVLNQIWGAVTGLSDKWTGYSKGKGDPQSSSSTCREWGHLWPPSTGVKVRTVRCGDHKCNAVRNVLTGKVRHVGQHKATAAG
jgi:hypothetical protein